MCREAGPERLSLIVFGRLLRSPLASHTLLRSCTQLVSARDDPRLAPPVCCRSWGRCPRRAVHLDDGGMLPERCRLLGRQNDWLTGAHSPSVRD